MTLYGRFVPTIALYLISIFPCCFWGIHLFGTVSGWTSRSRHVPETGNDCTRHSIGSHSALFGFHRLRGGAGGAGGKAAIRRWKRHASQKRVERPTEEPAVRGPEQVDSDSETQDSSESKSSSSTRAPRKQDAPPLPYGTGKTKSEDWRYEHGGPEKRVCFDGVMDCAPVDDLDAAEVNRILYDIDMDVQRFQDEVKNISKDMHLLDQIEPTQPEGPAEEAIAMKAQLLLAHNFLLQEYALLKLQGNWTSDHRVSSQLVDTRMMLTDLFEYEQEHREEIREYEKGMEEMRAKHPESFAQFPLPEGHSSVADDWPKAEAEPATKDNKGRALRAGTRGADQIDSNDSVDRVGAGLEQEGTAVEQHDNLKEGEEQDEREGSDGWEDQGEGEGGGAQRWHKLLWRAIRLEHEVKAGIRTSTPRVQRFIANKPKFEEKWNAAYDVSLQQAQEQADTQDSAAPPEAFPRLRNKFGFTSASAPKIASFATESDISE